MINVIKGKEYPWPCASNSRFCFKDIFRTMTKRTASWWKLGKGKTVRQIIAELGIPPDKVFQILVNHLPSQESYLAKDGDLIVLAMVLGAG